MRSNQLHQTLANWQTSGVYTSGLGSMLFCAFAVLRSSDITPEPNKGSNTTGLKPNFKIS